MRCDGVSLGSRLATRQIDFAAISHFYSAGIAESL